MPWTTNDPPSGCKNMSAKGKSRCVAAANAALKDGEDDVSAIRIGVAAGKEAEKYWLPLTQEEVNYSLASPNMPGKLCANCRFFMATDYAPDGTLMRSSCRLIDFYPLDILPTGYCDRHEPRPEPSEPEPLEVVIVEQGQPALALTPKLPGLGGKILAKFTGQRQPGQTILKTGDGKRLAIIVVSNGYEDRETEHVATKELERYVNGSYDGGGDFVGDNVLDWWHEKDLVIGDIIWADMVDGFLVEVARENDRPLSKELWDDWEQNPRRENWAASQLFLGLSFDQEKRVWTDIRKRRTTVLPLEAAANSLTLSEVVGMAKSRGDVFDQIFAKYGVENGHELLKTGGAKAVREAMTQAGIQARGATGDTETTGDTPQVEGLDALEARLIAMEKGFDALVEGQDAILTITDEHEAAIGAQKSAGETGLSQMQTGLDKLNAAVEGLVEKLGEPPKRASQSAGTPDKPKGVGVLPGDVDPLVAQVFGPSAFNTPGGES